MDHSRSYRDVPDDPESVPDPMRGWSEAAVKLATDCAELTGLGEADLDGVDRTLVWPIEDCLARAGQIPTGYGVDELRTVLAWLLREDARIGWSKENPAPYLRIYTAVIDRMRALLVQAKGAARPTTTGEANPCPWCGSRSVAQLHFGFVTPDAELRGLMDSGEVALGGCVIVSPVLSLRCNACRHQFAEGWGPRDVHYADRWGFGIPVRFPIR